MNKQQEALKLALEALEGFEPNTFIGSDAELLCHAAITAIREALADSALDRMAENAREIGLDYGPIVERVEDSIGMGNGAWDMVEPKELAKAFHEALAEQPAQQQEVNVPVADNTYGYAKSLAEAIFKQHFASDEHYASGRIVWEVNDTVIGILTQIDNMVADMVRRPAQQQEPVFWYKPYPNGMYNGPIHNAQIGDVLRGSEEWIPLYTTPQPSKQWVGLTDEEKADLFEGTAPYYNEVDYADAIEAKLREKNHG